MSDDDRIDLNDLHGMFGKPWAYNREGEPITIQTWHELMMIDSYRRVAWTEIEPGPDVAPITISTVWLGMDHSLGLRGAPVIFETMIFGHDELDGYCDRYPTEIAAVAGHDRAVALVHETIGATTSD